MCWVKKTLQWKRKTLCARVVLSLCQPLTPRLGFGLVVSSSALAGGQSGLDST